MGGALPSKPENILKEVIAPTITAPLLAIKGLYKASDPIGLNAAKKSSTDQLEAMQRSQQAAADAAAEQLRQRGPTPNLSDPSRYNAGDRLQRLRLGLASTIKTRAGGVTAPVLAAPALQGGKGKLGA